MTDGITDLVLERIDEGYLLLDRDGTVQEANRAAESLLGVDDVVGTGVGAFPAGVGGPLMEGGPGDAADGEVTEVVELEVGDGLSAVEVQVTPIDGEGDADRLVLLRDVSERVRRKRYRGILEASGDAVYTVDAEGVCTYSNRAHDELYGYGASEMVGMHVSEILDGEVIERLEDLVRDLIRADGARRTVVEHEVIAADGRRVPVENHISLLFDDDGEFGGTAGVVRDVSERKDREGQLERYGRIVDAMGDGVYAMDDDATYTMANDQMLEMNGYEREEVIGAGPELLHDEADIERFGDAIRDLIAAPDEFRTVEATLRTAGGEAVPIEVNLTLLTGDDGEFRGTVGVVRDVAERKEREQELERYETLLEIMPDTVVVTDTEGRHREIHGFEGWSGYSEEELIGEHLSMTTTEEAIEVAEELIAELIRDPDREKVTYEMDVLTKEGERISHENHLALLPPDEDGMIPGSMSVLRDVSDRKAHEQALEALNEATRELVAAESREAVVEKAVETASGVLDLPLTGVWLYDEEADALIPASYPDDEALPAEPPVFRPGDSLAWGVFETGEPSVYDDLAEAETLHNPETAIRSEVVAPLGDHGVLVSGSTEPEAFEEEQHNLAGILGAAVGTAFDRLDREIEREEQRRELRRKNERLEQFASVVSHDLRNPLNVAHARVKMALQADETGSLEKADDALDRMNELIEDLLTLAREGESVGQTEPVDLGDVAEEAWEDVEAPGASLEVEADLTVEADRARLTELFGNLFRNSVEHSSTGSQNASRSDDRVEHGSTGSRARLDDSVEHGDDDVTIRIGVIDDGSGGFYVEDDGPGIPPDEREAVFEHGVTGSADGTGFGLAIVEDIAEAHGWSVGATEGAAGGARFEFVPDDSAGDGEPEPP